MPIEVVNVAIGGANPQTIPVSVTVDPTTGHGIATITYTGANGGTDTLQGAATILGANYSSNSAQVNWQASNGSIQMAGQVDCYAWGDSPHSGTVAAYIWIPGQRPLASAPAHGVGNSISFDTYRKVGSGQGNPFWYTLDASGSQIGHQVFPPYSANFNCINVANILVPAPGDYTLILDFKDQAIWGLGNSSTGAVPTWAGKGSITSTVVDYAGVAQTCNGSFPLLPAPSPNDGQGFTGTGTVSVHFPAAGVYPLEVDWDYWYHTGPLGRHLHIHTSAGEIAPVTLIPAPPSGPAPSGNLTITPTGGPTNLQFTGQPISLTVTLSGIVYTQESYIPVLEGTPGKLFIYNSPSPVFNYPTYNTHAVDKAAAVANNAINISGNNGSWQGRLSVVYNDAADGQFSLKYNGNSPDSHVDTTLLTITADDVAWFFNTNASFDLFGITGSTGGIQEQITIDYMVNASVASVTPSTVTADGGSHTFTVSLAKPISPRQRGTQFGTGNTFGTSGVTMSGGAVVTGVTAQLDAQNWLTGWNVAATIPSSTSNGSITLTMTVSGNLTYLNDTVFTTGNVTYINNIVVATITTTGSAFLPPTHYSMSISQVDVGGGDSQFTINAAVLSSDNGSISLEFKTQVTGTSNVVDAGAGTLVSGPTAISGGYLSTFTLSTIMSVIGPVYDIGYTATDTLSGLTVTHWETAAAGGQGGGGGGGGGGGCPALEMFVHPGMQVNDCGEGTKLDCLMNGEEHYFDLSPDMVESLPIQWMKTSEEICYHFIAENGAEVIISDSTPIPTREALETIRGGADPGTVPIYSSQIRAGMHVITDVGNGPEWSILSETYCVGKRKVARLFVGGRNFAAGVNASKRIYTHNNVAELVVK